MKPTFRRFWRDESGQDLVEYALLLVLLTLVCIVAIRLLGTQIAEFFEFIRNTLSNV